MDAESVKLVLSIIGCIISILSLLGLGTVMTMFWKDKHDRKAKELLENSELREQARLAALKKIIQDELTPIKTELSAVREDILLVKKGTQSTCRNDLEEIYAKAEHDGFCSDEDKKRFEATYQAYHGLGVNGVMDAKRDRLLAMPEHPPVRKSKKVLVEDDKK